MLARALVSVLAAGLAAVLMLAAGQQAALAGGGPGACDVSGSMSAFTGPVASTAWILARATASLPAARTATVTYGRQVRPVTYPGAGPRRGRRVSARPASTRTSPAPSTPSTARSASARPGSTRILVILADPAATSAAVARAVTASARTT